MKIKNILVAVCGFIFGMASIINVGATEPTPSVQAATTAPIVTGEPGRSAIRPQGGVGNVKYVEVVPVAMPAETADGFGLFAGRILEDAMAGKPFGTGNRITPSSLVISDTPGNSWVLVHIVGQDISLSEFVVKTRSSDTGNKLGSLTPFEDKQYGPLALLMKGGQKVTTGSTTEVGDEVWFFARPPLFGNGNGAAAQVTNWVNYYNNVYGDFAVTVAVALRGKEDLEISWTVLSTKSTPAAPFVKLGADGKISLMSDADRTPRSYGVYSSNNVNGPWMIVGNVSHGSPTAVFSEGNSTPQAFYKAMAQ